MVPRNNQNQMWRVKITGSMVLGSIVGSNYYCIYPPVTKTYLVGDRWWPQGAKLDGDTGWG